MDYCLWCFDEIFVEISWQNVLHPPAGEMLCDPCRQKLLYLPQETCRKCHRPSKKEKCSDCEQWEYFYKGTDPLKNNVSVFQYNDFLQEMITQWKYRGDYLLGRVFASELKQTFHQTLRQMLPKETVVIPVPLSNVREFERAFNQAAQLAVELPLKQAEAMIRTHNEKQSKKSKRERMSTANPFILENTVHKSVLLVDDIYTTGRTLRHAAELLTGSGADVYALTLARG